MTEAEKEIPLGLCGCGCGAKTSIIQHNRRALGLIAGQPRRYLKGHHPRRAATLALEERFWSKVDRSGGPDACWPWKAALSASGYGYVWANGRMNHANRVAYELARGPIPDGLYVLHSCDNRPCCNPAHLRAGTQLENMRDAVERGRVRRGPRHGSITKPEAFRRNRQRGEEHRDAKLNADSVRAIRHARAAGESIRAIAARFGVSHTAIAAAARRLTWRHVS